MSLLCTVNLLLLLLRLERRRFSLATGVRPVQTEINLMDDIFLMCGEIEI